MLRALPILLIALLALPMDVCAQTETSSEESSGLRVASWVLSGSAGSQSDPSAEWAMASIHGEVPLRTLLPQTSPDSRIAFLHIAAGMQQKDDESEFAYRLSAMELALQRAWWSGSVTLMDLASNTFLDHDRTWFEVGTGPGIHLPGAKGAMSANVQLVGGRRSASFSDTLPHLDAGSGWHAGFQASVAIRALERLTISGAYADIQFSSGEWNLQEATLRVQGTLSSSLRVELQLRSVLGLPEDDDGNEVRPQQVGFRVSYLLR